MIRRAIGWSVTSTVLICLSGCTHFDNDVGRNFMPAVERVMAGSTTPDSAQILDALGPPHQITALPDGYSFLYQQVDIDEFQVGISSSQPVLRVFKLALARSTAHIKTALFQFDHAGRLIASGTDDKYASIGDGGSLAFVLAVMPVVDAESYEHGEVDPADWGMGLLDSTTIARDRSSDLDSGEGGFELRGSPKHAGQRTMEYR